FAHRSGYSNHCRQSCIQPGSKLILLLPHGIPDFCERPVGAPVRHGEFVRSRTVARDQSSREPIALVCGLTRFFWHDAQLLFLVVNQRIGGNALHEKDVAADSAAGPDDGFTAEYGRVRINRHVVLHFWVSLTAFFDFAMLILLEAARAKRNAVIQFHSRPNFAGFANDNSSAVIDEEMRANLCARVNIDPGSAVRPLRHDAWNQWQLF